MGQAPSSEESPSQQQTGRATRKRGSGQGDNIGKRAKAAAVDSPSFVLTPNSKVVRSRRKSGGRNDRRSITGAHADQAASSHDLTAAIPDSLSAPERLYRLIAAAMERSFQQVTTRMVQQEQGAPIDGMAEHMHNVQKVMLAAVTDDMLAKACSHPKLKPNPSNEDVEANLFLYQASLERLQEEIAMWDGRLGLYGAICDKAHSVEEWAAAPEKLLSQDQLDLVRPTDGHSALINNSDNDAEAAAASAALYMQVERLEDFAAQLARIHAHATAHLHGCSAQISKEAFSRYPDIDQPQKLIQKITTTS